MIGGQLVTTPRCFCCDDTGIVEAALGGMRPCSRCRAEDFSVWYETMLPVEACDRRHQLRERRA